ncbi:unnamed protein product [Closterium sp. Naga37s-1]|nr:unnamed protein product [Closterium sp. Naga37s-1]
MRKCGAPKPAPGPSLMQPLPQYSVSPPRDPAAFPLVSFPRACSAAPAPPCLCVPLSPLARPSQPLPSLSVPPPFFPLPPPLPRQHAPSGAAPAMQGDAGAPMHAMHAMPPMQPFAAPYMPAMPPAHYAPYPPMPSPSPMYGGPAMPPPYDPSAHFAPPYMPQAMPHMPMPPGEPPPPPCPALPCPLSLPSLCLVLPPWRLSTPCLTPPPLSLPLPRPPPPLPALSAEPPAHAFAPYAPMDAYRPMPPQATPPLMLAWLSIQPPSALRCLIFASCTTSSPLPSPPLPSPPLPSPPLPSPPLPSPPLPSPSLPINPSSPSFNLWAPCVCPGAMPQVHPVAPAPLPAHPPRESLLRPSPCPPSPPSHRAPTTASSHHRHHHAPLSLVPPLAAIHSPPLALSIYAYRWLSLFSHAPILQTSCICPSTPSPLNPCPICPAWERAGVQAAAPDGSWACSECGNVNYPFRSHCNRRHCGRPRPTHDTAAAAGSGGGDAPAAPAAAVKAEVWHLGLGARAFSRGDVTRVPVLPLMIAAADCSSLLAVRSEGDSSHASELPLMVSCFISLIVMVTRCYRAVRQLESCSAVNHSHGTKGHFGK